MIRGLEGRLLCPNSISSVRLEPQIFLVGSHQLVTPIPSLYKSNLSVSTQLSLQRAVTVSALLFYKRGVAVWNYVLVH